jgi:type I restriction enzyme S subunit
MSHQAERGGLVPRLRFPEFREAGEWAVSSFGGAATFLNGRAYKQEELLEKGKYRVLRVGNFFSNNQWYYSGLELDDDKYCNKGDLLYAWSASFGPRIWHYEKAIFHYHIWKVLEKKGVDKNFLFILLEYETERMKSQSSNGLGLLHITKGAIESWKCFLPGLQEQQKIADCLASLDERITLEARQLDTLKSHKKGLMQQLFPAEGETLPELRFPEFRDAGEWEEKPIGDFGDVVTGSTPSTARPEFYGEGNPFVSPADISDLPFVNETKSTLTDLGFAETRQIKANSVLFVCIGSTIGKVARNARDCATNQQINSVIPNTYHSSGFVYYTLSLNAERISNLAGKQAVPIVNKTQFCSVKLPVPTSLEEQERIADCLASLDDLITAQTQKLAALKTHKQGLMQQLFPALESEAA